MPSKLPPKTGVVLVNWNNVEDTHHCLQSLSLSSIVPDVILVWDNGSSPVEADRLVNAFPTIQIIRHPDNIGFAAANNRAAQLLLDAGMDYIWILNNDTIVDHTCHERLRSFAEAHPQYAAVTGLILEMARPDVVWYGGGTFQGLSLRSVHQGMNFDRTSVPLKISEVDFVSGCSIFIPKKTLLRFGLFPSDYIAYYEDSDWSLRLKSAGESIVFLPDAVLHHKCSASIKINNPSQGTLSPLQHFFMTRNRLWTLRRVAKVQPKYWLGVLLHTSQVCGYAFVNLLLGRPQKSANIAKGLFEGFFRPVPPPFMFHEHNPQS